MAMGSRLGMPGSGRPLGTQHFGAGIVGDREVSTITPAQQLAQILDQILSSHASSSGPGPLTQFIIANPGASFDQALENISGSQRDFLRSQLSASGLSSFSSLAQESDWEIYYGDLLSLSREFQLSGRVHLAQQILTPILQSENGVPSASAEVVAGANDVLAVGQGGGPLGLQIEHLLSHFVDEVADPVALISMGAAGLTYGAVRLGTFSLLGRTRALPLLTRGWGAQSVAFGIGVGAESAAFMGVGRGLRTFSGQEMDWSRQALGREFLGTAMMLGLLKFNGGAARTLLGQHAPGRRALVNGFGRLPHAVLPQLAMFSGIFGTHWLEERLGWRQAGEGGSLALQSLVTLVQFAAMGRLMEGSFGSGYARLNQDLHQRSEALRQGVLSHLNPLRPASVRMASAPGVGNFPLATERLRPWQNPILMMSGAGDGKGPGGKGGEDPGRAPTLEAPPAQPAALPPIKSTRDSFPPQEASKVKTEGGPFPPAPAARPSSSNPPRSSGEVELSVGMELGEGKYTVMEHIGQGGMKEVWRLHDHSYDRSVALYLPLKAYRETLAKRFENEYRLQAHLPPQWRVEHHAILDLAPGLRVPIVEYVPGHDLYHFVADIRENPQAMAESFPLSERLEIFTQLCEAVHANHEMGILHRDLKPENVRVDRNGRVRLLDYGIAKPLGEVMASLPDSSSLPPAVLAQMGSNHTRPGSVVGTPGYVAPEGVFPELYSTGFDARQSEVFSLGAVLYELTTGYRAFSVFRPGNPAMGELPLVPLLDSNGYTKISMRNTLQGSEAEQVPDFKLLIPFFADDPLFTRVEAIARRAMSPILSERFQTAEELRQAIVMAQPWVEKQSLDRLYAEMRAMELDLTRVEPNYKIKGQRDPRQSESLVQNEQNLRYFRTRWLREGENLIQGLRVAMGQRPFPEAHRMIADLSWQQLLHPGSRIHPADERALRDRIEQHDVTFGEIPGGMMRSALRKGADILIQLESLNPNDHGPLHGRLTLIPMRPEKNALGVETGNFLEGSSLPLGEVTGTHNGFRLRPGFYIFEWSAEGYAPMRVPLEIHPHRVLASLRENRPYPLRFELVPKEWVPEGMTVIHQTRGTLGHNYYFDGDTATATSFPMQTKNFPTFAVSRDPVTVAEYREYIESLVERNNQLHAEEPTLFKEELRSIRSLLPQTTTPLEARGPLAKLIKRFSERLPTGTPFWIIEETKKLKFFRTNQANLVDPTSHEDPFGAEIHGDQPVAGINYAMALKYAAWRSQKEGMSFRIISADEKEMVSRNGFDWRFPSGNGPLTDAYVVTRGSFDNADRSAPQPVGTHPLGTYRDRSLHGVRDLLGNIREFTSTMAEGDVIFLSGGSITLYLGANFNPSARYILNQKAIWDGTGAIRLALDLPPQSGLGGE